MMMRKCFAQSKTFWTVTAVCNTCNLSASRIWFMFNLITHMKLSVLHCQIHPRASILEKATRLQTRVSFSWKQLLLELARLCSPCSLCGRWLCASPSNTACPFCLLYLVWLVSSHYCSFVFGRASRASMETGRRAVCAQPGHLAAQRGRGRGGRWSRGSGSAGKRDIFPPPFLSSFFSFSGLLFSHPLVSSSFFLLSHFVHVTHGHRSHYNLGAHRTYWLTLGHLNLQLMYFYIRHFFCH